MRARDMKDGSVIRLPSSKVHKLRFGYNGLAGEPFHRSARTLCGLRIGNSSYDQFKPKQCSAVGAGTVELESDFCGRCIPKWRRLTLRFYSKEK